MRLFGKIGRRLLGWFLLVALIPLLFMGYQGYYFARRAVEQEVMRHMETVAHSKQLAIEQWFEEREQDMNILAADPLLTTLPVDSAAVVALLKAVHEKSPSYVWIRADVNRRWFMVPPGDDTQDSKQEMTRALPDVEFWISHIHLRAPYGAVVELARFIHDSDGRRIGRLYATVALSNSLNPIILDTTGLGQTGQAYLVDRNKVMLTPSRFMNHPAPLSHTMDTEGIRRALAGASGAGVYKGFEGHSAHGSFEGQQVLGAWAYLPRQDWALIAEMNADEAFAPLAALRRNAIIVALLTMGAILIVVAWVSRSISLPIQKLADASLDVSRGNFDRTVAVRLNNELGDLAQRFNLMVNSLRESQRQLVQSARLAAIGELVASVVHEVRNPLSAIKMNLRILESKCATDPIVAEHFALARTQTERLESMLTELLDYSKPVTLNRRPVSAQAVIEDALAHFKSDLPDGISVTTELPPNLPPMNADRERLAQVLLNLLLNARQAVNGGGTITITAEQADHALRISVRDNGQGISEENLKHIFEPFFTTRKNGTGLGLPNARKIVESHGGRIQIRSRLNNGTDAWIETPLPNVESDRQK
ncbi:MAG TPA: ATP-binding protein [bacterium]|jgi:signal transduction histidine kinase